MTDPTAGSPAADSPTTGSPEVHILQAKEVSIPILAGPPPPPNLPELLRIRSDFMAGRQLSRDDMGALLRTAETGGGGNGNCNIC